MDTENTSPHDGISRRRFIVSSLAAGGGLLLRFTLPGLLTRAEAAGGIAFLPSVTGGSNTIRLAEVGAFIRIASNETVTILIGSTEMGQGVMTGLSQIVAEELMVDWSQVRAEHAPASAVYGNPAFGGFQLTGGSSSIRGYYDTLRLAGATAREMLIAAGAQTFGVSPSACVAASGKVTVPASGKSMTYGQLAPLAATMTPPANPPLTSPAAFRLIGKSLQRVDLPSKVDGSAIYGIDVRVPGMVYATILHCPSLGGTVSSLPPTPAGIIALVNLGNAVAVVADNTWKARNAAEQLSVNWSIPSSAASINSANILTQAQQLMANGPAVAAETSGDVTSALSSATKTIDATYSLPYLSHICMEVLNCTASVTANSCEIWAPTQGQASCVFTAMALTGLAPNQITVHTMLAGGGLGRKFETDFIAQAIQVSQAVGKPVKLTWPREEDLGHDQYRPTALVRVQAGLDASNNVAAWSYRNVSPSILGQRNPSFSGVDSQATEGSDALPYTLPTRLVEWARHPATVPVGFWRSVGHSINAFAVESAIDELALAAGMDPYLFRRGLLTGSPRHLAVLDAAANLANWNTPVAAGHARGMALAESFNSIVAEVVDISQPVAGAIQVNSVACAIDCGNAINPDSVTAQMQGGIVHGLTAALWGNITFTNGRASARNFSNTRLLVMREMPQISVQIINSGAPLGGVGEPGVPPIAPAIANAYAVLTGQRIRTLPFFPAANSMPEIG